MYSGNDASTRFPTQWNLNPVAYQNIDTRQVDWAALAQQWIQMKETYPSHLIAPAPPPPPLTLTVASSALEGGEAPMDVESLVDIPPAPTLTPSQWNSANSWTSDAHWNQWNVPPSGWGWDSSKAPPTAVPPAPVPYRGFQAGDVPYSGYTNVQANSGFSSGYWTPGGEAAAATAVLSSAPRPEGVPPPGKQSTQSKVSTRAPSAAKPFVHPIPSVSLNEASSDPVEVMPALDAAKRRSLPAWIREGLEKMEREKQKQLERQRQLKAKEERSLANKREDNNDPSKSKFDSDGEESNEDSNNADPDAPRASEEARETHSGPGVQERDQRSPPRLQRSQEEVLQEVMLSVRRALTEILLEVTNEEILSVSQEEMARYKASKQAMRGGNVAKSQALTSLGGGLGLGIYGDSSGSESGSESEEDDRRYQDKYISDAQLQENIRRRKADFERTAREIEAQIAATEQAAAAAQVEDEGDGGDGERGRGGDTPPQAPPLTTAQHTNLDSEPLDRNEGENLTPPRNEKLPSRPESEDRKRTPENNSQAKLKNDTLYKVEKPQKLTRESSREDKSSRNDRSVWGDRLGKGDKSSRDARDKSTRDGRTSRDNRSQRDAKSSRDDRSNRDDKLRKDDKSTRYDRTSRDDKSDRNNRFREDLSRDHKYSKDEISSREERMSKSERLNFNIISKAETPSKDSSSSRKDTTNNGSSKSGKIKLYDKYDKTNSNKISNKSQSSRAETQQDFQKTRERRIDTHKHTNSPESRKSSKLRESSEDESSGSDSSSSRDSDSKSLSESSESSTGDSSSGEDSNDKRSKSLSSIGTPKKKLHSEDVFDEPHKRKSKSEHLNSDEGFDHNKFDLGMENASKFKSNENEGYRRVQTPDDEYTQSRKRSVKSRSKSYDRSSRYKSRTKSRDRSNRGKDYDKYSGESYKRDRDHHKSDDRVRQRSWERSKERSRSYERSRVKDRSRDRSRDRYRDRSRDKRRDSRSRSRSRYYRPYRN